MHAKANLLPSVFVGGCSSDGTDGGTGDTFELDTVDCCLSAVANKSEW